MTLDTCTANNMPDCVLNPNCYYWDVADICTEIPEPPSCVRKPMAMRVGELYNDPYGGSITFTNVDPHCGHTTPLANVSIRTPWGESHTENVNEIELAPNGEYFVYKSGDQRYAAVVQFMCGFETAYLIITTCYWVQLCSAQVTEAECTASGCYWWSDNTCRDTPEPPPQATGSIGLIIKPHSWYGGTLEQAVSKLVGVSSDIIATLSSYFAGVVEYNFVSIDIYPDYSKQRVILRINYSDTGILSMVAPVVIAFGIVAALFIVVAIVGVVVGWFTASSAPAAVTPQELIDSGAGATESATHDIYMTLFDIDEALAKQLSDCVGVAITPTEIQDCFTVAGVVLTESKAQSLGIGVESSLLTVLYTLADALNDVDYYNAAVNLNNTLDKAYQDLQNGLISIEEYLLIVSRESEKIKEFLENKSKEASEQDQIVECFIDNPLYPLTSDKPCIITKHQAIVGGLIGGAGLLALVILWKK